MNNPYLRYGIAFFLAIILQSTLSGYLQIYYWKPDFVLIVLVMFAIRHGETAGSTVGFVVGLIGDLIPGTFIGLGSLSKSVAGYVAGRSRNLFQERTRFLFAIFVAGFVHDLINFYIKLLGKDVSWLAIVFSFIVPNLLYTALVGLLIDFVRSTWKMDHDSH